MNPTQLPAEGTLALLVLQIIAVSGEFPPAFSGHFPGGSSYIESVIGKLKKDGLLRSYTKNGLRGLRLTASAKRLLLQKYPVDLAPYLTGATETSSLKSEPERRLRLHRFCCALTLHNQTGGILCFDYQADTLQEVFGAQVNITSIDFAAYERMMLHQ